ncbi:MAG TPA: adenosylhomocysteinase, partial [Nitrososphaera sp.]|nr:adenosylhomocysteinase [Nitrososphaera sp.]
MNGRIADPSLSDKGKLSHEWALARMSIIKEIVGSEKSRASLQGVRIGICMHITKETSVFAMAAQEMGAEIAICSANPLSAQDDIAAFLDSKGMQVYAWRGENEAEYRQCIADVASFGPGIIIDDGGDLHSEFHRGRFPMPEAGTEETTSGVKRLRALQKEGKLGYPVIAVNNSRTKFLFDNQHGTGQSTIDGILRATGAFLPGKSIVVCGYGWVGKGVAHRARGMGARVTVTEVDPIKALEAHMDGFGVSRLDEAVSTGEIFITCTGQRRVIRDEHFRKMRDGAILANAGHFDLEIDMKFLRSSAEQKPALVRPGVEQFVISKKKLFVLSEGRVVNLVAAEGNPPEVMALSFANQLMSVLHLAGNHKDMARRVYDVPPEIERSVGELALKDLGIHIDALTGDQQEYLDS